MKKISLILLSITALFNTSAPMAKAKPDAKNNAAITVAAAKLQAKPIVFFNRNMLYPDEDCSPGKCIVIKKASSLEMGDIINEQRNEQEKNNKKHEQATQEWNKAIQEWKEKKITQAMLDKARAKKEVSWAEFQKSTDEMNQKCGQKYNALEQKIKEVEEVIAKKLGACAVFECSSSPIFLIDPLYDITQEVIDVLNKEYIESNAKKPTCNHCCDARCPHKQ